MDLDNPRLVQVILSFREQYFLIQFELISVCTFNPEESSSELANSPRTTGAGGYLAHLPIAAADVETT